ncbi:MAG: 16S rRNA (cytosine(1402)-N(4))-methyltransferase RsmH [Spirochaetales bacterium]|nr:16S rRNA (cytosine(1402)-N(4))-methyltransferase RsmH [Spirochaetales bacterium]
MNISHKPVLIKEILDFFPASRANGFMIDANLGEGGHSAAFLAAFPALRLLGIDADEGIMEKAKIRLEEFGSRVSFYNGWFSDFFKGFLDTAYERPVFILFDLGISMFHYEESGKGFSFVRDEDLDMRISSKEDFTAYDLVNSYELRDLTRVFRELGEERFAFAIAKKIIARRNVKAIGSSKELADIIASAVPIKNKAKSRIHPATRCFQAVRIEVNNELENLKSGIEAAFDVLADHGRMAVISYHSLEDRIAKHFFKEKNRECICPPEMPICQCRGQRELQILTKRPLTASEDEIAENRAARSAKLRVVEKLPLEGK